MNMYPLAYQLDLYKDVIDIRLELCRGRSVNTWAIRERGSCINKSGEWEYEPIPSSRDEEFMARCRFSSVEEAVECYKKFNVKSRFEHYRSGVK